MPGRTLATWYGRSKLQYTSEEATSEGNGGESSASNYHPPDPPQYSSPPQQGGQYDSLQYDYNYYPNVNPAPNTALPSNYTEQQQSYYPQQTAQYSPHSPASPASNYSYSNQSQSSHHEMSYPNSQGAYNPSPSHYGSPNHAQNNNYATGSNPWTPQQSAADYTHHPAPSPQQVLSGSPSATPSPAHTPGAISSPPPVMAGQYPAHQHGRHPPIGSAPPVQSHGHPAWNHPGPQAMPVHPGVAPLPPQTSGYYPPPHSPLMGAARGGMPPGPPQHAHMASDRHSPHHSANPAAWNNAPAQKPADGRLPPPSSHPQNNGGPGNPLFSLQMLVNQDMNRTQSQANSYRSAPTSETVDLSSSSTAADSPQSAPIQLTRSDKLSEHSAVRNGNVATSTVTSLSVKSPPLPLNGNVESVGSLSGPTPTNVEAKDKAEKELKEISVITQIPRVNPTNVVSHVPGRKSVSEGSSDTRLMPTVEEGVPLRATIDIKIDRTKTATEVANSSKSDGNLSLPHLPPGLTISPVRSPKSPIKRAKKVDSILENLVESGSIKLPAEPVIAAPAAAAIPSVIVPREATKEATCPLEVQLPSPGLQKGAASPTREEISPTSMDDESGKPRRKRKLDKPVRVSKTDADVGAAKAPKDETAGDVRLESARGDGDTSASKVGTTGKLVKPECDRGEKSSRARRRSSSEGSEPNSSSSGRRGRRRSESNRAGPSACGGKQPEAKNSFIEVESELEKMFAGIEGIEESAPVKVEAVAPAAVKLEQSPSFKAISLEIVQPSSSSSSTPVTAKRDKRGRPKGSKNEPKSVDTSMDLSASDVSSSKKNKRKSGGENSPKKKAKGTKLFAENGELGSEMTARGKVVGRDSLREDSGSSNASVSKIRGPLIRVQGPRESPVAVNVYNAPTQAEPALEKAPKQASAATARRKHSTYHSDLDYRGKAGSSGLGMFTSTLSARYDAHTADRTWLCVFCKCGPHAATSAAAGRPCGDLFGPYVIAGRRADEDGAFCGADAAASDRDICDEQKKGGRNKKSLRKADMVEQFKHKMSKKAKRALAAEALAAPTGLIPMATADTAHAESCYEVWVHEDCALWAAGTRIVGSRIYGLQDAVWAAVPTICNKCGLGGANIGCIARNCKWRLHFSCALQLDWELDESTYIARCNLHKINQIAGPSNTVMHRR